ncbi:MAG: helix-hairpin-helix domain-containing protein [bacterium]|nr:helix-hairpin-helix domain-containing protein [bacterium]
MHKPNRNSIEAGFSQSLCKSQGGIFMKKSKTLLSAVGFISILYIIVALVIIVPSATWANPEEQGATPAAEEQATPPAEQPAAPAAAQPAASEEKININTAGEQELLKLKRITPDLAKRIIAYREKKGPFKKVEDILKVKGLGNKFWKANKNRMTVGEGTIEEKKPEEKKKEPAAQPSEQPKSESQEPATPPASQETTPSAEGEAAPQGE